MVIEAESSKVGVRIVPPAIWHAMRAAPRITVAAPVDARSDYLTDAYADLWANPEGLAQGLIALRPLHSADTIAGWQHMIDTKNYRAFVEDLITRHYDMRYGRQKERNAAMVLHTARLDAPALDDLAGRIEGQLSAVLSRNRP